MKHIRFFLSENFPFLVVKFSIYLNRSVFVMEKKKKKKKKNRMPSFATILHACHLKRQSRNEKEKSYCSTFNNVLIISV